MNYKQPRSIQVIIFSANEEPTRYLLLKRVDDQGGFWQSVTGSLEINETHQRAAVREVYEETGIACVESELIDLELTNVFEIARLWRPKYAPDVTHNEEICFALETRIGEVKIDLREHQEFVWVEYDEAMARLYWESNKKALAKLQEIRGHHR
ncbi:MAG: dihydroneopterin triphosphate diphosphatase [Acidobacteriota bacterium]